MENFMIAVQAPCLFFQSLMRARFFTSAVQIAEHAQTVSRHLNSLVNLVNAQVTCIKGRQGNDAEITKTNP